mmetsp:Transcript_36722/g.81700  ORF Transcript_36722/g.81700 Transcript_36722/m.81700 type:complete len:313 (+) Transcript_36722:250-1188(+)
MPLPRCLPSAGSSLMSRTIQSWGNFYSLAPHHAAALRGQARPSTVVSVLEKPSASSSSLPTALKNFLHKRTVHTEKPPAPAPLTDSETLRALESAIGPLDTKPAVPPAKPVVVVISGPSGVGKDSVVERLKEKREDLYFVVTATSRPKRPAEVEGRDYFFVSREKFEEWIAAGQLLEHALVYGDYKGIPRQQVDQALAAGTDVVLRIDVQGAATLKRLMPDVLTIFVSAESEAKLVQRLVARKTESLDKLAVRVQTARQELQHIPDFDYVVVNNEGRLEECVAQISAIIDAEKLRVKGAGQRQAVAEQQLQR